MSSSASLSRFRSAIEQIRDVLRSSGITGMDSMRHICLYLASRFTTLNRVEKLGIPPRFAWETIMQHVEKRDFQDAMDAFYDRGDPEQDCLIHHFDRLFGTDKFSLDVKGLERHVSILKLVDSLDLEQIDQEVDVLGWVYEQHLGTGSGPARDLGQFFTDRAVCSYMIDLCQPELDDGKPQTVCDPSMGTGGFLTAYVKYFKKHGASVDWLQYADRIIGFDTDTRITGVARLNMFMETNGAAPPHMLNRDALCDNPNAGRSLDDPQTPETYDIILANMPFGLKGIQYERCRDKIKKLGIKGTKSEPLFLQLMMASLNLGGRCAVVVPDGVLINTTKQHIETRRHLLDHFELHRVIKMKGKFFMNTSIQPSILFFENSGHSTGTIEFWELDKNKNGEIVENLIQKVERDQLDDACVLDPRTNFEQSGETPIYPHSRLKDICKVSFGKRITKEKDEGSLYPVYGSGGQTFKTDDFNRDGKTCKVGRFAISEENMVMIVNGPYWLMDSGFTVSSKDEDIVDTQYLWYCLLQDKKRLAGICSGSCQKNIVMDKFYDLSYPIPPLDIQREIVETLDRIYQPGTTDLSDTLRLTNHAMDLVLADPKGGTLEPVVEASRLVRKSAQMVADVRAQMVADVRAQMVAIMRSVRNRSYPMIRMREICKVSFGKRITKGKSSGSLYPVYGSGEETFRTNDFNRDGKTCKVGRFAISETSMVMIVDGPYWLMDSGFTVESSNPDIMDTRYLWYCLLTDKKRLSLLGSGSCQKNIVMDKFYDVSYPIPPIEFQQSIVQRLDALQAQSDALEQLQKNAEDNARFILESYLYADPNQVEPEEVNTGTVQDDEDGETEDEE